MSCALIFLASGLFNVFVPSSSSFNKYLFDSAKANVVFLSLFYIWQLNVGITSGIETIKRITPNVFF